MRQKAVRWPCGVYRRGVGSNSVQCTSCQKWVDKKYSGIKGSVSKYMKSFISRGCLNPVTSAGEEMMQLGVDICGLSEVRWDGQVHFTTLDGHTIVYSGRLTQGMSGVAVWIHRKITGALVGYEPISDLVLVV